MGTICHTCHVQNIQGVPEKCIHILRDVIYVLLFEVELNYGSNV